MVVNVFRRLLDFIGLTPRQIPLAEVVDMKHLSPSLKVIQLKGNLKRLNLNRGSYLSIKLNYIQTRKYTLAHLDEERGILSFLVYLHKNTGTGKQFMNQLQLGDKIKVNSLRSNSTYLDLSTARFVFFGDETSLGLASSLLDKWLEKKYSFLFLFELDEENKGIPQQLGFINTLVYSKKETFRNERLMSQLPPIQSETWKDATYLLTGNAKSIQIFRKVIQDKTTSKIYTRGYWIDGIEGL